MPAPNHADTRAPLPTLIALFLASVALLALEIAQVRIFSYSIDPLLVFSAISVALLGLGAGGIAVALRPELTRGDVRPRLAGCLAGFALGVLVAHGVFARTSERIGFGASSGVVGAALPLLAVFVVPYFFVGVFMSLVMTRYVRDIGRAYFVNLAGSALGCVVLYPLLRPLGVEILVAGIAALVAWSAVALAPASTRGLRAFCLVSAVLATVSVPFAVKLFPFRPRPGDLYTLARAALQKRYPERSARDYESRQEYSRWDPVSRVEVYAFPAEFGRVNGVAPMRFFVQDSSAGSLLLAPQDHPEVARALFEGTVYGGAYAVNPQPRDVLVIGLGGAPDIQAALHHGAHTVTGVEINASAIEAVRGPYARFLGDPYGQPHVTIVHRDGRSFVERTQQRYDVIQMTGADTYSASGAGAFMFSESYLYTIEAFRRYFAVLADDGVLSVIRFGLEPLRIVATEIAALRSLGIAHPENHLIVLQEGIWANVLLTRRALSPADAARVVSAVTAAAASTDRVHVPVYDVLGFGLADRMQVLYAPGFSQPNTFSALLEAAAVGREQTVLDRLALDYSATTDARPFFFQFLGLRQLGAVFGAGANESWHMRGLRAYLQFLAVIALVAAALILLPLAVAKRRGLAGAAPPRALGYFTALGLGYLFVELTLMQKSALFLGHPTYSIAVTLLTLLLASGLGSGYAARLTAPVHRVARVAALVVVGILAASEVGLHPLFVALLPAPFAVRVAVLVVTTFPLGFVMGMPFPMGLRAASARGDTLVAWGLGVNSFASVLASLLAVPLAMFWGFPAVSMLAMGLYAFAALTVLRMENPAAVHGCAPMVQTIQE
jgi:spermidine synthase